ncbi:MAG: hypothetical protein II791_03310 [Bacteroidales bacterium]|nr:hypothetical protein [Bacteroidales bacterium]
MKRILILVIAVLAISGCDFVRTIAGRPTSAQVEKIRIERMQAEEAAHQARLDSMRQVQKQMADSLAALEAFLLDSLSQAKNAIRTPSNLGGLGSSELTAKYYIVVGAFRDINNAMRMQKTSVDAGYPAQIISFRNGLNAVAICPSNSLTEIIPILKTVRSKDVFTKDAWLLENK